MLMVGGATALGRSTLLRASSMLAAHGATLGVSTTTMTARRSYYDKFRADHEQKQDPHEDFFQDMPRMNEKKEPVPDELKRVDIDVQARGDTMHRWFVFYSFFLFAGVCYYIWEPLSDGEHVHKAKYNRRGAPAAWEVPTRQPPRGERLPTTPAVDGAAASGQHGEVQHGS